MKNNLFVILFLNASLFSLYSQTNYIQSTTDALLCNKVLLHSNELKIGNSTSATERAKNMIKIGDGSYIQIGEWEADDLLSFKASKYNFTGGNVGIGTSSPSASLEVFGSQPTFILRGTPTYLQIGVPPANGHYAPYSKPGDVVFRPLSGVDGHSGLIFNLPVDDADGNSSIKFGDDQNHGWFSLYNNKIAVINGKVRIGIENPTVALDVNGTVRAKEVKIETGWADFVFNEDYNLRTLSEVNDFIKENKHLPEIPSITEVKENEGVNVGEMQVKLLQKIEELTLYLIRQNEKIQILESELSELKNK